MKATIVYTDYHPLGHNQRKFNVGIATLSACLKSAGHRVKLIHISEKIGREQFVRRVEDSNPDLLGFSFITNMWPQVQEFTRWVSKMGIPTVHGGLHPTISPEEVIGFPGVQILCRGEGEGAILDLCNNIEKGLRCDGIKNLWIKKKSGEIIRNPLRPLIEDLDELPFLDYEIFDYSHLEDARGWSRLIVMASRGCPYQCTYCCNHLLRTLYPNGAKYVRFKSVERLLAEIRQGLRQYDFLQTVRFVDDTLSLNKSWFAEFAEKYPAAIGLPYTCNDRANQVDERIAAGFKRSGCTQVEMGIESGDEHIRNDVMKRNLSDKQILNAYSMLRNAGIRTTAFNILGVPFETMDTLLRTVKLNAKANPDGFTNAYFYPFQGTVLAQLCRQKGYCAQENVSSFFEKPIIQLDTLSNEQVAFIYKYFFLLTELYRRYLCFPATLSEELIRRTDKLLCSPYFPYRFFNKVSDISHYFQQTILSKARNFPLAERFLRLSWRKTKNLMRSVLDWLCRQIGTLLSLRQP